VVRGVWDSGKTQSCNLRTGTITQSAGTVTGTTSVSLTSGSGAIGTIALITPNVTANTTGNVTLTDSQILTGNGVSTGANFSLTDSNNGGMSLTNTITATGTLGLVDTGTNSPIVLGA